MFLGVYPLAALSASGMANVLSKFAKIGCCVMSRKIDNFALFLRSIKKRRYVFNIFIY